MGPAAQHTAVAVEDLDDVIAARTLRIVERRRAGRRPRRRGWLVRRALLAADVAGLLAAFALSGAVFGPEEPSSAGAWLAFAALLPLWVVAAKVTGLYDRDEERAGHSTVDDVVGVFQLLTAGVWLLVLVAWATGAADGNLGPPAAFWLLGIALVPVARSAARAAARRSELYVQNVVIAGAGRVGQLVARKALMHPEYGINLVGFVDDDPRTLRAGLEGVPLLGPTARLPELVRRYDVDRLVVAFSGGGSEATVALLRTLRDEEVQIDIVPRLFDLIGPRVVHHAIEGLPLVGLPPVRLSRSSRLVKRLIDVAGAALMLVLAAPLLALLAILIRLDSPGPVLFRQSRLGTGGRPFTLLKLRTMRTGAGDRAHREYIRGTLSADATASAGGVYKLDSPEVTRVGAPLRRTSLDELPQLFNVLRGDMSLVGPRPCIAYEVEEFAPHHFERFLVPQGITGLWQVTARASATFGEALDMDVAYARGWSLGLDLRLLARTPLQVLRQRRTTR
jgi:exopolysaccharide biosynthesis polyprenyl glycosylphosphotransferase